MNLADFRADVVRTAVRNLGYGEEGRNNAGKFIRAIGGKDGMEWCALFAGHCYRRAYALQGYPVPDWLYRRAGVPEPGARRLGRNIGESPLGFETRDPAQALPGDVVVWRRGLTKGHIAVVEAVLEGLVHTIEGNVGAFPAKVRRLVHDVSKERLVAIYGLRAAS